MLSEYRVLSLSLILLLVVGSAFAQTPDEPTLSPNPFAIMGPPYSHLKAGSVPLEKGEEHLQMLELTGARWTRNDFWWSIVEPQQGQWEFDYFDQAINSYQEHQINLLLILCYGSEWNQVAPDTEEEMQRYGEYVYQMVNRYKYWVKHWEIWNEPNILPFWTPKPNVEHYTRMLQIAYQRAKEADPDCVVLGGAMAGADLTFLRGMYNNGAKGYFDVLSYHTYGNDPNEASQRKEIEGMKAIMQEYGDDKPLWLTETGIYTGPAGVSETIQAERIVKSEIRWVSMGVEKIIQLTLKDWTDDLQTRDATSFRGFVHASGEPKPSFFAHRTLCNRLGDKTFLGSPALNPNIHAYLFGNNEQNVLVLWTDEDKPADVQMNLGVHSLLKTDLYGNENLLLSDSGDYSLNISQSPIYLEGVQDKILLASRIATQLSKDAVAIGDTATLVLTFSNPFDQEIAIDFQFKNTPEIEFLEKEKTITLKAGQTGIITIPIQASAESQAGEAIFNYIASTATTGSIELYGKVEIENPFALQFEPFSELDLPSGNLQLRLINRSSHEASPRLTFQFPEGIKPPNGTTVKLPAGQSTLFPVQIDLEKMKSGGEYPITAMLETDQVHAQAETKLRLLKAIHLNQPVTIDGKLNEWEAFQPNIRPDMLKEEDFNPNLTLGEKDITARGWLAWDSESLYLALEVWDDQFSLPDSNVVWNFDSLQIAIDGANDAGTMEVFDRNDFEYEIALLRNGSNMVFAGHYPEGHIASVVEEQCEVAIIKDEEAGKIVYEVRIPKTILPGIELQAGKVIGFSFIINDNDGPHSTDREGWLELTPGIGYGKQPELFYDALLWP